ncbi:MAG: hypothetical protein KC649_02175 [Candidatus Omnitrophica bacterium]|nr:hypothetical protein [Candidatus Omnitrophota bacterium]
MRITSDRSQFDLRFQDFAAGSVSNEQSVAYDILSNTMVKNKNIVTVQVAQILEGVEFQVRYAGYQKKAGDAVLVSGDQSGWIPITQEGATGIVNKQRENGRGQLVAGSLIMAYRALAVKSLPPTETIRELLVTFVSV